MRRMTTGLVFTLSATCSDLRGSSPDQAIKLNTCTATAKRLLVNILKHGSHFGKQFCNHYSYNFDFVNYLICLDFEDKPVLDYPFHNDWSAVDDRRFERCFKRSVSRRRAQ